MTQPGPCCRGAVLLIAWRTPEAPPSFWKTGGSPSTPKNKDANGSRDKSPSSSLRLSYWISGQVGEKICINSLFYWGFFFIIIIIISSFIFRSLSHQAHRGVPSKLQSHFIVIIVKLASRPQRGDWRSFLEFMQFWQRHRNKKVLIGNRSGGKHGATTQSSQTGCEWYKNKDDTHGILWHGF